VEKEYNVNHKGHEVFHEVHKGRFDNGQYMITRAIIFDFTQTLADSATGFRLAEKMVEQKLFSDLGLTSWQDFINNYRLIRGKNKENSNFSRRLIWQELYTSFQRNYDDKLLGQLELEYWDTVKTHTRPFPETEDVLMKLATKYKLALITNTQGRPVSESHTFTLFPELEKFFDPIIIAGESGIPPKPDPVPFLLCLEKLGLDKEQVIYVGDDWKIDIFGAMNVGIKPVWLKHHLVQRNWPEMTIPVPVIIDLNQLLDLDIVFR